MVVRIVPQQQCIPSERGGHCIEVQKKSHNVLNTGHNNPKSVPSTTSLPLHNFSSTHHRLLSEKNVAGLSHEEKK